jgi:hypothetical protein
MANTVFDPGTGGSLKSNRLVSAFVEAVVLLVNAENAVLEAVRPANVTMAVDIKAKTTEISLALPIAIAMGSNGQPVIAAFDYLTPLAASGGSSAFTDGGSELNATNLVGVVWELANKVSLLDSGLTDGTNRITIATDFDGKLSNITANLEILVTIDSTGKPVIDEVDYV